MACWRELENQPGCYIWLSHSLGEHDSATWSGPCLDGLAEGHGTITVVLELDQGELITKGTGQIQHGKLHGRWATNRRHLDIIDDVWEGSYVDGKARVYP